MTDENEALTREVYKAKQPSDPPPPWRRLPCFISGVTAVGFGAATELLLVLTHSSLGIIDCSSGDVIARLIETDDYVDDPYPVTARGIGPLEGQHVHLAGLWGGGLRTTAADGWTVHRASPNWPAECAVLCSPESPELFDNPDQAVVLVKDSEPGIRALGFSDSGRTLIVATTELFLWTREQ